MNISVDQVVKKENMFHHVDMDWIDKDHVQYHIGHLFDQMNKYNMGELCLDLNDHNWVYTMMLLHNNPQYIVDLLLNNFLLENCPYKDKYIEICYSSMDDILHLNDMNYCDINAGFCSLKSNEELLRDERREDNRSEWDISILQCMWVFGIDQSDRVQFELNTDENEEDLNDSKFDLFVVEQILMNESKRKWIIFF